MRQLDTEKTVTTAFRLPRELRDWVAEEAERLTNENNYKVTPAMVWNKMAAEYRIRREMEETK